MEKIQCLNPGLRTSIASAMSRWSNCKELGITPEQRQELDKLAGSETVDLSKKGDVLETAYFATVATLGTKMQAKHAQDLISILVAVLCEDQKAKPEDILLNPEVELHLSGSAQPPAVVQDLQAQVARLQAQLAEAERQRDELAQTSGEELDALRREVAMKRQLEPIGAEALAVLSVKPPTDKVHMAFFLLKRVRDELKRNASTQQAGSAWQSYFAVLEWQMESAFEFVGDWLRLDWQPATPKTDAAEPATK